MVVSNASGSGIVAETPTANKDGKQPEMPVLVKPKIDEWEYRTLTLPNGLEALLVSDDQADMAAAAMDVRSPPPNFATVLIPNTSVLLLACTAVSVRQGTFAVVTCWPDCGRRESVHVHLPLQLLNDEAITQCCDKVG